MPGDIGSLSTMARSTRYTEYEWKVIRSSVLALEEELNNLSLNGRWEVFSVSSDGLTDFVIVARR